MTNEIIEHDGTIVNRDCNGAPVLFLDCDGVLAPGNGQAIDRETVAMVANFVRMADARIVLCSDRARFDGFYDDLVSVGFEKHRLRGQCDPATHPTALTTSKVQRVLGWLEFASENDVHPSRWCIVDDCRSFSRHWATSSLTIQPAGKLVSRVEMALAWTYLTGKLQHSIRRWSLR